MIRAVLLDLKFVVLKTCLRQCFSNGCFYNFSLILLFLKLWRSLFLQQPANGSQIPILIALRWVVGQFCFGGLKLYRSLKEITLFTQDNKKLRVLLKSHVL